jgi:hypothetical protein
MRRNLWCVIWCLSQHYCSHHLTIINSPFLITTNADCNSGEGFDVNNSWQSTYFWDLLHQESPVGYLLLGGCAHCQMQPMVWMEVTHHILTKMLTSYHILWPMIPLNMARLLKWYPTHIFSILVCCIHARFWSEVCYKQTSIGCIIHIYCQFYNLEESANMCKTSCCTSC